MTGWSSITLAEAQSSRWYSDVAKTTELAREIVSADEIHVKVPSLTSSTEIYVDYDGIRSDYAVTDTYGRNAVWSDYKAVVHNGGTTDATGNNTFAGNGGITIGGASGKIGASTDYDGTDDFVSVTGSNNMVNDTAHTIQMWLNADVINTRMGIAAVSDGLSNLTSAWIIENTGSNNGTVEYKIYNGISVSFIASPSSTLAVGSYDKYDFVRNTNSMNIYKNASSVASTGSALTGATNNRTSDFGMGRFGSGNFLYYNGKVDEFRYRSSELSANWLTTEYTNQNNAGTFWGTVTDAGSSPINSAFFLNFV